MIRHAKPADYEAIDQVMQAAFGRWDEVRLVARLRANEDVMFELVAEDAGEVVGHVLYSRLWADRDGLYASLGPLAVHPRVHRTGVGASLMKTGVDSAREFGAVGVLVLGDPDYYGRFGFSAEAARQVVSPYQALAHFQALPLETAAFQSPVSITYPDAFNEV